MSNIFSEAMLEALHNKRVEPEPRMCGGQFGYVFHKYPIKGGITPADVIAKNIMRDNALLRHFTEKYK